jgi:hypothetical protein
MHGTLICLKPPQKGILSLLKPPYTIHGSLICLKPPQKGILSYLKAPYTWFPHLSEATFSRVPLSCLKPPEKEVLI